MRVCRKCDLEKPLEAFPIDRRGVDGRAHRCKDCKNSAQRAYLAANPEVYRRGIQRSMQWRRENRATLVAEHGGACVLCGYDRHIGALQFHHRDPATKSFEINGSTGSKSLTRLREEAAKCVLLCANCHAEVEGGFSSLPAV